MNKCSNRDNYYQGQGGNKGDGLVEKTALALAIFFKFRKAYPLEFFTTSFLKIILKTFKMSWIFIP
jgi:hypothetical protein